MCGIVGVAGEISKKDKDAFQDMFVFSQVRGPHSSGVASVDRYQKDKVIIAKDVGRPDVLIDYNKQYDKAIDFMKKFMLGHNRWATTGKVNKRNAHPFCFDNIVGCHNGTIPEHRLRKLKEPFGNYGTDSEAVLANIDKHDLAEVFEPLDGAWAFVWYDNRDGSLNFLRNVERTLFYCYSKSRKTIYWASEKGFLNAALDRNGLDYDKIYVVEPNMHYKWVIPEKAADEFEKPEQKDIKSGVWGVKDIVHSVQRFKNNYNVDSSAGSSVMIPGLDGPEVARGPFVASSSNSNVILGNFPHHKDIKNNDGQGYIKGMGQNGKHMYRGFRGEILNKTLFENITAGGCAWCSTQAEWGKPVRFVSAAEHICLDCNSDGEVREICGLRG